MQVQMGDGDERRPVETQADVGQETRFLLSLFLRDQIFQSGLSNSDQLLQESDVQLVQTFRVGMMVLRNSEKMVFGDWPYILEDDHILSLLQNSGFYIFSFGNFTKDAFII